MPTWSEEHIQMIADCEARESRLSEWERNFIETIRDRLESDQGLTDKQIEKLNSIWNHATERG